MLDHSGNIIDLPYFGCWSGCAQDYCYIFGHEISKVRIIVRRKWMIRIW
jgi:hypothetical protein